MIEDNKVPTENSCAYEQLFVGERALFAAHDLTLNYCTFADGESPLKESCNIKLYDCLFRWKYPLWYSQHIVMKNCTLFDMSRAGIWYTNDVVATNCTIEAPKIFRRASELVLENITMPNAAETLWNCSQVKITNLTAKGDYFAMNSKDMDINGLNLVGNYSFDGCKNVVMRNSRLLSKDAFWNCENVEVYDSFISGEYLGWNAKNVTLTNCTIESLQGLCYMHNVVLKNCRLMNTTLAFEYSSVDAEVKGSIDSVLNPSSGRIEADSIKTLTLEPNRIDPVKTDIIIRNQA